MLSKRKGGKPISLNKKCILWVYIKAARCNRSALPIACEQSAYNTRVNDIRAQTTKRRAAEECKRNNGIRIQGYTNYGARRSCSEDEGARRVDSYYKESRYEAHRVRCTQSNIML